MTSSRRVRWGVARMVTVDDVEDVRWRTRVFGSWSAGSAIGDSWIGAWVEGIRWRG